MPRRAATTTQADIERTCRALMRNGLTILRVVTRADGVSFETDDGKEHAVPRVGETEPKREIVL
jgi:hypothetical protein